MRMAEILCKAADLLPVLEGDCIVALKVIEAIDVATRPDTDDDYLTARNYFMDVIGIHIADCSALSLDGAADELRAAASLAYEYEQFCLS